jgi:hypothetical protein
VSFAASISARALSEATNAPYILYVMARTNSLVNEQLPKITLGRAFRARKYTINN